jgi:PAS domain S-box-containing protein
MALALAQAENQYCDELALQAPALPSRCIRLDMGPLLGGQGCQLVLSDTTASKALEKQLRHNAERCGFAMEAVGDCLWECNLLTGRASYSRQFTRIYGFTVEELGDTLDDWRQLIHPDDQGCFVKGVQECLAAQLGHFACKLRVRCKDGSYKWILCRGAVSSRTADGKPECLHGMHTDITAFLP